MLDLRYRTMAGRCRSGGDLSGNVHAVNWSNGKALCGKAPQGKSAGWGEWDKEAPTCACCLKKMEAIILPLPQDQQP
jgi:hypothetical protein